jgi:DNA modification methylase
LSWQIIQADALSGLAELPDESVHACVTSPPYWGLRDYGLEPIDWPAVEFAWPGGIVQVPACNAALGLERTVEEYIGHLVLIFREVARVLRADGSLWVNIGDAYVTRPRGNDKGWDKSRLRNPAQVQKAQAASLMNIRDFGALKPKDLIGLPWLLAFALRSDGWYLRNSQIWDKLNPMPESVSDRCTRSHEDIFHLTKSARYYFDVEAIREEAKHGDNPRKATDVDRGQPGVSPHRGLRSSAGRPASAGRRKRTVWSVATVPFAGAHNAAFPPKLIEPCILASTSHENCAECGAPWRRILESNRKPTGDWNPNGKTAVTDVKRVASSGAQFYEDVQPPTTLGWEPTCEHESPGGASTVLDPFAGTGTLGLVALRHGRDFIGIEVSAEYVDLARRRIIDDAPLLNSAAEAAGVEAV